MRLGDPERHQEGGPVKTETKDTWAHRGPEKAGRSVAWSLAQPAGTSISAVWPPEL